LRAAPLSVAAPVAARWSVVALLAAVLFLNYVDRGALPTAAPLIQDELALSGSELGMLLSAFFWSYALLQIPIGWLAERRGAQRVLLVGLLLWSCATLLSGFAHSLTALLCLRLLLGAGESAGFPCVSKLLATVMPLNQLGRANGVVAFGYLFGPAVGTFLGGALITRYGWRATFLVFGLASLAWLLPLGRVRLPSPAALESAGTPAFGAVLRQRSLWGTSLGHFSGNYTFYFMLTWLPTYLVRERGFSIEAMATVAGQAFLVNALSALAAGWLIDRASMRGIGSNLAYKAPMLIAHAGSVLCMLAVAFGPASWALAAIYIAQGLSGISSPGTFAIGQILAGPKATARWVGVQNTCANCAGIIGPALTGVLVDATHHFTSAFVVAAGVSLLGILGWGVMVRRVEPLAWSQGTLPQGAQIASA
jgi:MFS family permease